MNTSCHIVRDVFVLYHDGAVSDETRREVKAHLAECPNCRKYYKDMETGYRKTQRQLKLIDREKHVAELEFEVVAQKLRRAKIQQSILFYTAAAVAVTGGVLITVAAFKKQIRELR